MYKNQYSIKKRLFALFLAITFIFFALILRIFYIAVINSKKMNTIAFDQWTRDLPITAKRGKILDKNGVILADNSTSFSIYCRARQIVDVQLVATKLSQLLQVDMQKLEKKLNNKNISEQVLARQVTSEIALKIAECDFDGIFLSIDNTRHYPYDELLCQVLGYSSIDNIGQAGIEKYYEKFLKGTNGKTYVQSDILGFEIEGSEHGYIEALDGQNITLTIDFKVQMAVENTLKKLMLTHLPKQASAMVMDAQSGQILAMANLPSFNLNQPPREDLSLLNSLSRNTLVVDVYEPGSTFKIFTTAINLEEYNNGNSRCYSPEHIFGSSRIFTVDGQNIKCWSMHKNGAHSNQNLQMALNNSCNPIFCQLALAVGKEKFYDYLQKFKLSQKSQIDFPGEANSIWLNKDNLKNCDLARIGFGQSIAVSPIQLLSSATAIVNGGKYFQPTLVQKIETEENQTVQTFYNLSQQIISKKTSNQMALMLEEVVAKGSGKQCFIENARVGGKTGTAQKYENGRIADGKYVSSFFGFYPANNPKYSILLIVDEPTGQHYGSIVAAPYAKQIFEQMLQLGYK